MTQEEIFQLAEERQSVARRVLAKSGIADIWRRNGCRVNLIGSLRMGLLAAHRDIDLHVYSSGITEESSFAIAAQIAKLPFVSEMRCINGLRTDEHCIAWHFFCELEGERWQFDVIHIEAGTQFDGFFERMADRITEVMTPEQKATILRLKFEAPSDSDYHGVEFYEAVIADGVTTLVDFDRWVRRHRQNPGQYWIP